MTAPPLTSIPEAPEAVDPTLPALPPIERVRGPEYPRTADKDERKVAYVESMQQSTNQDALARYKQGARNILYANGRQHVGWKKTRGEFEDLPLAENDIRVTYNYIAVMLRARVQRLTSADVNWRAIPEDNSYTSRDRAKLATRFLSSRHLALEMDAKGRQALMQANLAGVAAFKSFWNPAIGPLTPATMFVESPVTDDLGQPMLDELGQPAVEMIETYVDADGNPVETPDEAFHFRPGDTDTSLRTVFNIRLNPEAQGWTEGEGLRWLIDSEVVPISVARERYLKIAHRIRPIENGESALTYERMVQGSATARNLGGVGNVLATSSQSSPKLDQLCVIREYWELRSAYFPKGRLIVVVGGAVAYDGPWPHGVFPYAPVFGEPAVMSAYGRPPVNDMISPQDIINREATAIAKEMWLSGVGKFVAWDIPGVPEQINATADEDVIRIPMRAMLGNRSINDVFKRMDPATIPPERVALIDMAKATLFDIGAYHEVSRGQIPPGLDSGVAIQMLLEQESTQLKEAVEAFKRSYIMWARHQLAIAKWGYSEDRWIPVHRPDLGFMLEKVDGITLPDHETIGLDLENFRPTSESSTRAEVKELMGLGIIPPRLGLRIMDLGAGFDEAFASQTRHYARAMRENLAFERQEVVMAMGVQESVDPLSGAPVAIPQVQFAYADGSPLLLDEDDDLIHIDSHNEILLDDTVPWLIREPLAEHVRQHRERADMKMAQEAMMAAGPQQGGGEEQGGGGPPE